MPSKAVHGINSIAPLFSGSFTNPFRWWKNQAMFSVTSNGYAKRLGVRGIKSSLKSSSIDPTCLAIPFFKWITRYVSLPRLYWSSISTVRAKTPHSGCGAMLSSFSLPSSSNSRRTRIAWFRPLRNRQACLQVRGIRVFCGGTPMLKQILDAWSCQCCTGMSPGPGVSDSCSFLIINGKL